MQAEFIVCEGCRARIGAWRSACPECGRDRKTGNVDSEATARRVVSAHPEPEPAPSWSPWLAGLAALGVIAAGIRWLSPGLAAGLSLVAAVGWIVFFVKQR
jgi:hypothetical protein